MKIAGKIKKIIFKNNNGFAIAIFILHDNKNKSTIISGPIESLDINIAYELEGDFFLDEKRNSKVFKVQSYNIMEAKTEKNIINFLSSSLFPGVGKTTAQKIYDYFGEDTIKKIKDNPEDLLSLSNIKLEDAKLINSILKEKFMSNELLEIFSANNLKIEFLIRMQNILKNPDDVKKILEQNFYEYAKENNFLPFAEVDKIFIAFNGDKYSEIRVSWHAYYILNRMLASTGNTNINFKLLGNEIKKEFNALPENEIIEKLMYAKKNNLIYFKEKFVYTKESWEDEVYISEIVSSLILRSNYKKYDIDFENIFLQVEKYVGEKINNNNFKYNNEQRECFISFMENDFQIITGGPGSGKTTIILGLIKFFELINKTSISYALLAPTGRASSRISENSDYDAQTIHKYLKYNHKNKFDHDEFNPRYVELVIIDESTMIDNNLFASLLKGIQGYQKLILIGDVDQLPSVSYGDLFNDLIKTEKIKVNTLLINNRQVINKNEKNGIIELARTINNGEVDNFNFNDYGNLSFFDLEKMNNDEVKNKLVEQYSKYKPSTIQKEIFELQTLSPMYGNLFGVTSLNNIIKYSTRTINNKLMYKNLNVEYNVGDKIMCIENDSTLQISNGDVGYISDIIFDGEKILYINCIFNERLIKLTRDYFSRIILSYACTIHKTQGSEYKNVILFIDHNNPFSSKFVSKKMIYTAVTRAKENIIIFSKKDLFIKAAKKQSEERVTNLKEKIINKLEILKNIKT